MSDQSDSQNAFDEVFVTESDPSSPSVDPISEPDSSPVGRTRLLADIPPTIDREKELRSKFLNDPSTPEEHNLTLKYLTARQSGDKQTLRELRHQILARRSRRHPPADAVPGLDVPPLREHAWLNSLADAGVRVSSDFFDRLQECVAPNPPIIDLGDDSNSSTSTMAQDDHDEAVYHRRTDNASSKAPVTEENPPSDQEDEPDVGPGSGALWLPEDATNGPLTVEIDGRRQREPTAADSAANKRQAVEDPGTSAANEVVQVEDLDPTAPGDTDGLVTGANDPAPVSGTSWLSGSASSIREKIRELITRPSFLTSLSPGIFYRYREWIEKKEVPLTDSVAAAFAPSPVTAGKVYQPAWDVREDESLYSDIPENGGILAYRILKGMQLPLDRPSGSLITPAARLAHDQLIANNAALELIEQYLEYQRLTDSYKASLETCQGLLRDAEEKLAPLEDEVVTLRDRAALLEETEENVKALTKAVEAANNEKEIAVLDASAAEARGAANAVAEFKASDDDQEETLSERFSKVVISLRMPLVHGVHLRRKCGNMLYFAAPNSLPMGSSPMPRNDEKYWPGGIL
ncbi:hypothetical protein BVRB_7g168490 [Beta vulgaris subsp. vulgaris]|nr:hypothetical protein BVRB_7g168490 [Beta vulgaris subsp. vulgaris]